MYPPQKTITIEFHRVDTRIIDAALASGIRQTASRHNGISQYFSLYVMRVIERGVIAGSVFE